MHVLIRPGTMLRGAPILLICAALAVAFTASIAGGATVIDDGQVLYVTKTADPSVFQLGIFSHRLFNGQTVMLTTLPQQQESMASSAGTSVGNSQYVITTDRATNQGLGMTFVFDVKRQQMIKSFESNSCLHLFATTNASALCTNFVWHDINNGTEVFMTYLARIDTEKGTMQRIGTIAAKRSPTLIAVHDAADDVVRMLTFITPHGTSANSSLSSSVPARIASPHKSKAMGHHVASNGPLRGFELVSFDVKKGSVTNSIDLTNFTWSIWSMYYDTDRDRVLGLVTPVKVNATDSDSSAEHTLELAEISGFNAGQKLTVTPIGDSRSNGMAGVAFTPKGFYKHGAVWAAGYTKDAYWLLQISPETGAVTSRRTVPVGEDMQYFPFPI